MLEVKTKLNGNIKRYVVYESHDEALSHNITISELNTAIAGDYIRTDNDYVIPLLSKEVIRKGKYGDFIKMIFPNLTWNNMQYYDSGNFRMMPLVWSREPRPNKPRVFVTARHKLFAMYLSKGMDIYTAFNSVFKQQKSRAKREQLIKGIIDNPNFANYMVKEGFMEDIKKVYEKAGISHEWFAKQLKEMVEDKSAHYNVRIKAIEMLESTLNTTEKVEDNAMDELRDKFKISKVS